MKPVERRSHPNGRAATTIRCLSRDTLPSTPAPKARGAFAFERLRRMSGSPWVASRKVPSVRPIGAAQTKPELWGRWDQQTEAVWRSPCRSGSSRLRGPASGFATGNRQADDRLPIPPGRRRNVAIRLVERAACASHSRSRHVTESQAAPYHPVSQSVAGETPIALLLL